MHEKAANMPKVSDVATERPAGWIGHRQCDDGNQLVNFLKREVLDQAAPHRRRQTHNPTLDSVRPGAALNAANLGDESHETVPQ